jgi:hypothetical protein
MKNRNTIPATNGAALERPSEAFVECFDAMTLP